MKKLILTLCAVSMLAVSLAGCGGGSEAPKDYNDGTYTGKSELHEGNEGAGDGYGEVTITLKDNTVTECEFKTYQLDGTLKDGEYGKQNGEVMNTDFYNKAQRAVLASSKYAEQLAEKGHLNEVDAISGATISYSEFQEAVNNALSKAEK